MNLHDKILLHKRTQTETVNDKLRDVCQVEHARLRFVDIFVTSLPERLIAYNLLPKKT